MVQRHVEATKRPKGGLEYRLFAEEAGVSVLKNLIRGEIAYDGFEKGTLDGCLLLLL